MDTEEKGVQEQQAQKKKKEVVCVSCYQKVEVTLVAYGGGYIAHCPLCGKLAYNSD